MTKIPSFVFEELSDPLNYVFLTLIEFKRVKYLTIVENMIGDEIQAYVLDQLEAEGIDQKWFMTIAIKWFYAASERYPLSFEFAKHGAAEHVQSVLKTFPVGAASRVIGKIFVYNMLGTPKVRRRKIQSIPEMIPINFKARETSSKQHTNEREEISKDVLQVSPQRHEVANVVDSIAAETYDPKQENYLDQPTNSCLSAFYTD